MVAPSGECLRGERRVWCICRVKAVWSILERFWGEVLTKRRYTNVRPLPFLYGWSSDHTRFVNVGKWEDMEVYADMIPKDSYDSSFFRAVINIHANEFQKAQQVGLLILVQLFLIKGNLPRRKFLDIREEIWYKNSIKLVLKKWNGQNCVWGEIELHDINRQRNGYNKIPRHKSSQPTGLYPNRATEHKCQRMLAKSPESAHKKSWSR